jgi:hypothetical protein
VHGVRPRDRRTTEDTKKFPPLHVNPERAIVLGQLCIDRSWLRVVCCKVLMSVVVAGKAALKEKIPSGR